MRTRVKTSQPPKARENASDQIVTGFSFASDWFEKMVRVFWTNHKAKESKSNTIPDYFRDFIKFTILKFKIIMLHYCRLQGDRRTFLGKCIWS